MDTSSVPRKQCSRKDKCINPNGSWLPNSDEYFSWEKKNERRYLCAQCKVCKNQYNKEYHAKHRETINTRQHQYYDDNQEWMIERARLWRQANPDKVKGQNERYYAENTEYLRLRARIDCAITRAEVLGAEGTHSVDELTELYIQQEGRCGYCGMPIWLDVDRDVQEDHVRPLTRGGSNWIDNIILCCSPCNHSKYTKTLSEWQAVRGW